MIELVTRRDMRALLRERHPIHMQDEIEEIKENGRKIIYQTAFISFLAGKNQAAREGKIQFWTIEANDLPLLDEIKARYLGDFHKILDSMVLDVRSGSLDQEPYLRRCDMLLQMLTWTAYNKGKIALWDDEIVKPRTLGAQAYRYEGIFMFRTARDDDVCAECAPLSGMLAEDPSELEEPPLHVWCRCEIVVVPTVKEVKQQESFLTRWWHEHGVQTELEELLEA